MIVLHDSNDVIRRMDVVGVGLPVVSLTWLTLSMKTLHHTPRYTPLRSEPGYWRGRPKHHLLFPSPQLIQIRTLRRELAVPFAPSSRAGMVVCQQCPSLVAYLRPACLARNRVEGAATVSVG